MTLSRHEIEEIARGTEGYAPDAVLGYPVSTIRALCALALQALDAGQPVAWRWKRKIDPPADDPWLSDYDPRLAEPASAFVFVEPLYRAPALRDADTIAQLVKRAEAAEAEAATLREALERVNKTLTVPAAEYVPAIGDAFVIIDQALEKRNG
jgi:hypothetical protein